MADTQSALVIQLEGEVKTLKDLKAQVEELAVAVSKSKEGTEQYTAGMEKLTKAQGELEKATSLVKGQTSTAADSYYALNKQLVAARKEYKNLSAAEREDAEVGGKLLENIADLDEKLKGMDATMGQFQRNVGNYPQTINLASDSVHDLADAFKATAAGSTTMGKAMDSADKTMKLLTKNPIMALISIVLPILMKIVDQVKQSDTAMQAVNRVMASMQPIMDLCTKVIEKLANVFAKLADKVAKLISKIVKGKGTEGGGSRGETVEEAAETMNTSMSSMKSTTEKTTEVIDEQKAAIDELTESMKNNDKVIEANEKKRQESIKLWQDLMKETEGTVAEMESDMMSDIDDIISSTQAQISDGLTAPWLAEIDAMEERKNAMKDAYAASLSIMSSIADIYEANSDADAKAAKKAKALRIASTIIETLSGATAAYMNSVKAYKNPALGIAMGVLNAATVAAAGMANIAKMKSTSSDSTSATTVTATTATVSAPTVAQEEVPTAVVTGSSQSRTNTRAYVVWSDLEGAMSDAESQESETSW